MSLMLSSLSLGKIEKMFPPNPPQWSIDSVKGHLGFYKAKSKHNVILKVNYKERIKQ